MTKYVGLVYLGLCRYKQALRIQENIAHRLKQREDPRFSGVLILLEHPPVYTYGIRKNALTATDEDKLKKLGADVEYAGRGGLITFHGPGQMVAWPVLDLKSFSGVRRHIFLLEESIIQLCHKFGLNNVSRNKSYPGVWRGDGKLCAVGVRASRFVTTHGLALNVSTDLSWFDHIIPCGIHDKHVTSLSKELDRTVSMQEAITTYLECFSEIFSSELVEMQEELDLAISCS